MTTAQNFNPLFYLLSTIFFALSCLTIARAEPQFAAFKGASCNACHVSPTGGGPRKPKEGSWQWITPQVFLGGDLRLLQLTDYRPFAVRSYMFPMQGALHFGIVPNENLSLIASNDFGSLRELYVYVQNLNKIPIGIKAGVFQLPYGLNIPDHTSFIKEGRLKNTYPTSPPTGSTEIGLGAGRLGSRYRGSGVTVSYDQEGLLFGHVAFTNGAKNLEGRTVPGDQSNRAAAQIATLGARYGHWTLGGSALNYQTDQSGQSKREARTSIFGIFGFGPLALLTEYGLGEDKNKTTAQTTSKIAAFYGELIWKMPETWSAPFAKQIYVKVRDEFLDPDRRVIKNTYERRQAGFEAVLIPHLSLEAIYRNNREHPNVFNDDLMALLHFFF